LFKSPYSAAPFPPFEAKPFLPETATTVWSLDAVMMLVLRGVAAA
jgi:hypothetical protein